MYIVYVLYGYHESGASLWIRVNEWYFFLFFFFFFIRIIDYIDDQVECNEMKGNDLEEVSLKCFFCFIINRLVVMI